MVSSSRSSTGRSAQGRTSRLRLIVIQALVFSLFATLFARLWYLQVVGGESFQAQAASQGIREIVVQPHRGLIVDAEGRPLVANRTSWVVSVDRTMLGKMPGSQQERLLQRLANALHTNKPALQAQLLNCSDTGSESGECWNGSPYQPVPVADDGSA
jgi:penicillin-binding protein 2